MKATEPARVSERQNKAPSVSWGNDTTNERARVCERQTGLTSAARIASLLDYYVYTPSLRWGLYAAARYAS